MEALQIPVNYKGDGTWFFSAELSSGYYELEVTPHLFLYKILLPNGKKINGTIPTLLTKIESFHQDPELKDWLEGALSWKDRKTNYQDWNKTDKFELGGKSYSMTSNVRTGDIELNFGAEIYVSQRQNLGTAYPEIYGIKRGELSELITAVVADAKGEDEDGSVDTIINLPVSSNKVEHYEISGLEVWIAYEPDGELLVLHLSSRVELTHISTIEHDVAEFRSLHDGRYREEVLGILADAGFMDVKI